MPDWAVDQYQDVGRPEAKIGLLVSPENAVFVAKAVQEKIGPPESVNDFQRQNPAAKKLMEEVNESFDLMMKSLVKEVRKILADYPGKSSSEEG